MKNNLKILTSSVGQERCFCWAPKGHFSPVSTSAGKCPPASLPCFHIIFCPTCPRRCQDPAQHPWVLQDQQHPALLQLTQDLAAANPTYPDQNLMLSTSSCTPGKADPAANPSPSISYRIYRACTQPALWKRLPGAEGVSRRLGPAPTCGRSLSTDSCFQSGRLGRNPPASTANTAIHSNTAICSRPCQLSHRALQPARPLGSPSPSPARGPLHAGRHQSRVLAQGDPAEPNAGSGYPRDVPSMALIRPSL